MQQHIEQHIEWTSPAALWDHFNGPTDASQRRVFRTPAILRFATDEFMESFIGTVQTDPHAIGDLLAVPETWKQPAADAAPARPKTGLRGTLERARIAAVRKVEARQGTVRALPWNAAVDERPLKLYQPAHQRYYLVTAALVCRTLGLPDRTVDSTKQEKASFVVRMLEPLQGTSSINPDPLQCNEYALVGDAWVRVDDPTTIADGEVRQPLSPLTYDEIDGRKRRMFNGMIPVAKREALMAAKLSGPAPGPTTKPLDPRQWMLKTQVIGPWSNLEDVAKLALQQTTLVAGASGDQIDARNAGKAATLRTANEQIQTVSWYILLDLDQWLHDNAKPVWNAITAQSSGKLSGTKLAAYEALDSRGLIEPLLDIRAHREQLETVKSVYRASTAEDWPDVDFQFITATEGGATGLTGTSTRTAVENALAAALDAQLPSALPARSVSQVSATVHRSPWFAVRCVFERPNCGALVKPVVSDPTAAFQMASFFDPDAPARPIRVPMPADTTPAGLRKFDKNTAFVLSDVLCGQVSAIRGLSFGDLIMSVLPWPLHKDLGISPKPCPADGGEPEGMVCSFSIPIITICALILLMLIVKLLDIIFFWMPFFQICLPVPKFDAKLEVKAEVGP
ncbi:MAG TPA: hypothetical protein VF883_11000 [Thermoanaerobaculia bacterium]|jgi:hypothetical protein